MKPETILTGLASEYWKTNFNDIVCEPFGKGASGRFLARLRFNGRSIVGICWNLEREDNDAFIPASRHLLSQGVSVAKIRKYVELRNSGNEREGGLALVEDLGDTDLLSLADLPWAEKREYYIKALRELDKLHHTPPHEMMQPPFDEVLYEWEQTYFAEHFLGTHLGWKDWEAIPRLPELKGLAKRLAALPRCPVHRDFQSQNIMIRENEVALIDFQGMRMGRPEYDVASLLYDPYARLKDHEREELWEEWSRLRPNDCDRDIFRLCACQRLMQALGAFANIAYNKGIKWYLDQIQEAISSLSRLLAITKLAKSLEIRLVEVSDLSE